MKQPTIDPHWLAEAEACIACDGTEAHDLAAEHGQIFDNVKHMTWFIRALAEQLQDDAPEQE